MDMRLGYCFKFMLTCLVLYSGLTHAVLTMTNGDLVVTVREDNGAIEDYKMDGVNYFGAGSHVSDWALQLNTDTATFKRNTTDGSTAQPVTVTQISPSEIQVAGNYSGGGANVDFVRSLSILPGFDALIFSYKFINKDAINPVTISIVETFDPDQGLAATGDFGTYNDVVDLGDFRIAQAVDLNGLSFVIGSQDVDITLAAGNPFRIGSGNALNSFFASPFDGEGVFADQGVHIGVRKTIPAGGEVSVVSVGASASNASSGAVVGDAASDSAVVALSEGLNADIDPDTEVDKTKKPLITWGEFDSGDSNTSATRTRTTSGSLGAGLFILLGLIAGFGRRKGF